MSDITYEELTLNISSCGGSLSAVSSKVVASDITYEELTLSAFAGLTSAGRMSDITYEELTQYSFSP